MRMPFYLLIILMIQVHSKCSENYTLTSEDYQCSFYFTYGDQKCESFQFSNCIYQDCQNQANPGRTESCTKYNPPQYLNDWESCLKKCCSQGKYQYTERSLREQCKEQKEESYALVAILGGVFGGLAFLGCILWICCCVRKQKKDEDIQVKSETIQKVETANQFNTQSCGQSQQNTMNPQYQTIKKCSVCLYDLPNVDLSCGHYYHEECLAYCLLKKKECPACSNTSLKKCEVHCSKCLRYQFNIDLSTTQLPVMKSTKCASCIVSQVVEN